MPLDIIICNIPGTLEYNPLSAPAILKAAIVAAGFSCRTIDFNIRLYDRYRHARSQLADMQDWFINEKDQTSIEGEQLLAQWADEIVELNPRFVGISVFTYQNRKCAQLLARTIKQRNSQIHIALGGQGLGAGGINGQLEYPEQLKSQGIIDSYIKSEGERSIIELIRGQLDYPGINSNQFTQIENLNELPVPDYSDYEFDLYDVKRLPIVGSRGCVRSCSFCDIHEHWRYRYRSGESIAAEMLTNWRLYGIRDFNFADSLINGALKEFKNFIAIIAEHNRNTTEKISWAGQFIVRNSSQLDETYWQNIADSGGYELAIGVETGSDRVREHMNKRFTNADLDYTMEQCARYGITCRFLMIVGYPTETLEDHWATIEMLKRYQPLAKKVITFVELGTTLAILPGTPLHNQAADMELIVDDRFENNWINRNNTELTFRERIRRRQELISICDSLGYFSAEQIHSFHTAMINDFEEKMPMFENRIRVRQRVFQIRSAN
jgi:radical SAM superfamily enzyme YgiQ (UPF0313 family)